MSDPNEPTTRRLARIDRHRAWLEGRSRRVGNRRMIVFLATAALATIAWRSMGDPAAWTVIALGVTVFAGLVRHHDRIETARRTWDDWATLKRRHEARRTRDWSNLSAEHHDAVDPEHPFAGDLDLLGERSLLHLIDTTVSLGGHRRLRDRLLAREPDIASIAVRQRRVAALVPARHMRDRLALEARRGLGARRTHWDSEGLEAVASRGQDLGLLRRRLAILVALALASAVLIVVQARLGGPPLWGITLLGYLAVTFSTMQHVASLFEDAMMLEDTLEPLRRVLGWLEERKVPSDLEEVVEPLRRTDAHRPARVLRRVQRVAWAAGLRTGQIPWILVNAVVPWDVFFGVRLELARREMREHLPRWLEALHELETLSSLAELADVTPAACFPVVDPEGPVLEATALGHPLLPPTQCVPNDFTIERSGHVDLITGSNMSGKSTFLRTVGLNVVLALAGAPVYATSMRLRPVRVFTCIQVSDSVNDGISYFYAEVRRLAALVRAHDDTSGLPQLSLVDEIYRGTNNRERRAGSEAFVEHLIGREGALLLSTHDLELASLAAAHDEIRNLHFREEIRDDRMEFDFLLHGGPCPTSNALRLMAREGLPVPRADEAG